LIDDSAIPADVRNELMPAFRRFLSQLLVDPVLSMVGDKKRLLLFPDGILYFVPFEALAGGSSPYLVERFDVRYAQSATVLSTLRARNYPEDRAPFLGMGGALYSGMVEKAPPLADATRHVQLQLQAQRNFAAGTSQREVYAALFGDEPMKFLQGSLIEVQELGKLFQPAAIFTGADMSENRLKQMSRDGSLAKYRILHLATHGFSFTEIPEMSGIAMTIKPEAEGGEDGYLNAPEIARLGLRADLAVLSACDTGLGRIYGGEGVAGLTSSLLIDGANRALVSLWPVSDAGTMRFMREMYTLTEREGISYDIAVNRVKRRFIAGEFGTEFQDIRVWAPFIHYGL
jgi:CHAT domain-containing protein